MTDTGNLIRILIMGVAAYTGMIFLLRISGKRTLSKWNAFDFIVTVALGSSLATVILSEQVSIYEGISGFFILIFLQFTVTFLSVHTSKFQKVIKARPAFLVYQGEYITETMKKERVTASEIRAALRSKGIISVSSVGAVVLETDGTFSILKDVSPGTDSTLEDVHMPR